MTDILDVKGLMAVTMKTGIKIGQLSGRIITAYRGLTFLVYIYPVHLCSIVLFCITTIVGHT